MDYTSDSSEINFKKYGRTKNIHIVSEIVDEGLCVRCGACEPSCPVDIIKFNDDALPYITDEEECLFGCVRCLRICPGEYVDFDALDKKMFGTSPYYQSVTGVVRRCLVTFSTDDQVRKASTSGGFVTELFVYMLENNIIDGALVLGSESGSEGWREKSFIARTPDEVRSAMKSKYRLVPHLRMLKEMQDIEGRYAIVGLPCHIHAIHKYVNSTKKLKDRIILTVGLYCNVAFEPKVLEELCELNGLKRSDVKHLDFRAGHWPGTILATLQNGVQAKVLNVDEMRDEFNLLKLFYAPNRCNMCTDFSAEFADIAVGDPWLRDRPDGEFIYTEGWTSILTRTEFGDKLVAEAEEAGVINTREVPVRTFMVNWERGARYKREFVPQNMAIHKFLGYKIPQYNRKLPKGTVKEYTKSIVKFISNRFARYKWFRKFGVKFFQTKLAIMYFRWNRKNKAENFLKALPRLERFVKDHKAPYPKSEKELENVKLKFKKEYK